MRTADSCAPATTPLVLVVDDHSAIRRLAAEVLTGAGFRVMTADDGAATVELAARYRPALILLDIIMPGVDGYATAAHLRGHPATRDIPILFVTARLEPVYREVSHALGATGQLSKPFTAGELVDAVARAVAEPALAPAGVA